MSLLFHHGMKFLQKPAFWYNDCTRFEIWAQQKYAKKRIFDPLNFYEVEPSELCCHSGVDILIALGITIFPSGEERL